MDNTDNMRDFENKLREGGVFVEPSLFVQVPINFIKNSNYTVNQKMLYMDLWTYGINKYYGYPSQSNIEKETGLSKSTQRRVIAQLEELGGLYLIYRYSAKNKKEKLTNLYYLATIDKDGNFSPKSLDAVRFMFSSKVYYVPYVK